jgi:hypothetical protein
VSATPRYRLGRWVFPSGNFLDAYVEPDDGARERRATCEWESPPPLSVADESYYLVIVLPALTRRAQEYLERPGRAMVLFT